MKISLVGSYNLADGYFGAAKALRGKGVEVDFVPAHFYFSESSDQHVDKIIEDLKRQNSDVVLWWRSETLSEPEFYRIKKSINKKFILYSWDDPHQFESIHKNIKNKIKYFDICFTCCESSINDYLNYGCEKAVYCPPGFDPEVHYPDEDDNYKCDISLVCTNLYHGNSITQYHHLSRKVIMELLISQFPDLDIRIYGSDSLKQFFPDHYKGWVPFNESRKVFYNSKINISTHIRPDGYKYINERVTQILGSKGLLFVDDVNGINEMIGDGKECVVMDLKSVDSVKSQIEDIIMNSDKYDAVRISGNKLALEKYTWKNWAKIILDNLNE